MAWMRKNDEIPQVPPSEEPNRPKSVDDGNPDGDYRLNEAILKRWISNAPDQKDMAPEDLRGMPAFPALTEEDLDHLVAYLATLD